MKLIFAFIFLFISSQVFSQENTKGSSDSLSKKYSNDLNSPDEIIRLTAAKWFYDTKHPNAINALIKTINDGEDINHFDITTSVVYLIQIGEKALLPVSELMLLENEITRLRAITAIAGIMYDIFVNPESKNKQAEAENFRKVWEEIGLNDEGTQQERESALKKLKEWLLKN